MRVYKMLIMSFCMFNVFAANAQITKKYMNDDIAKLAMYQDGNDYQKDLLLFLDMLKECHPAFSSEFIPPFDIDSLKRVGYEWGKSCSSIAQLRTYLQSIATQLNDGHTTLLPVINKSLIYPFMLFKENGRVYLRGVNQEYKALLGKEIIEINSQKTLKVIDSFRTLISCDNDTYFYDKVESFMQLYSMWEDHIYCLPDSTLQFKFSDGSMIPIRPISKKEINLSVLPDNLSPNSIRKNTKLPFLYEIVPEKKICYLQFNTCVDQSSLRSQYEMIKAENKMSEETIEKKLSQVPRFDDFLADMFKKIREEKIQTLVIDVRDNSGGNSRLCDVLLSWLKPYEDIKRFSSSIRFSKLWEETYPSLANGYRQALLRHENSYEIGNIYSSAFLSSLTNKGNSTQGKGKEYFRLNRDYKLIFEGNIVFIQNAKTYSSAGLLISTVMDNNMGIVIGSESSYKPCNYGDILYWELPNTNIKGTLSHKVFTRPNIAKCTDTSLTPTVHLTPSWLEVLGNKDICWEWILSHY
nr:S41 family peptidase [uncultured Bacteroides sp.]